MVIRFLLLASIACLTACVQSSTRPNDGRPVGDGDGDGDGSVGGDGDGDGLSGDGDGDGDDPPGDGDGDSTAGDCIVDGVVYPDGAGGIPAPDGCNTCSCSGRVFGCTLLACDALPECMVALRLDVCCGEYIPVTPAQIAADECLVDATGAPVDPVLSRRCQARSPFDCTAVLCEQPVWLSRLAAPDGAGGCRYADECQSDADCMLGFDTRPCCTCPRSMPVELVQRDMCLIEAEIPEPVPDACNVCFQGPICGACPPAAPPTCQIRNSFSLCQ